jgi:hypothetical protein
MKEKARPFLGLSAQFRRNPVRWPDESGGLPSQKGYVSLIDIPENPRHFLRQSSRERGIA